MDPVTKPLPTPAMLPTSRSAQLALAVFGVVLFGLLAFRGYGNRLGARPTDQHFTQLVDLNRADKSELQQIPGIGPNLADAILGHRQLHGKFSTVDDLGGVKGIGTKTVDKVRPWVNVVDDRDTSTDSADAEKLERKPIARPLATSPRVANGAKLRAGDAPINPNTASETELQRLPGVGPTMSQRIVETREKSAFKTIEDLRKVRGIGAKTLENIRPYLTIK